jgi:hypothetical protein
MFGVSSNRSQPDAKSLESQVVKVLDEIIAIGGIESVILASREGFPMFTRQNTNIDEEGELLIAAMLSGLMATVEGATSRLGRSMCELVTMVQYWRLLRQKQANLGSSITLSNKLRKDSHR